MSIITSFLVMVFYAYSLHISESTTAVEFIGVSVILMTPMFTSVYLLKETRKFRFASNRVLMTSLIISAIMIGFYWLFKDVVFEVYKYMLKEFKL